MRETIAIVTNRFQRRPRQDGRHTPNRWPVSVVAPLALLIVGGAAFGLYYGADALLASKNTGNQDSAGIVSMALGPAMRPSLT